MRLLYSTLILSLFPAAFYATPFRIHKSVSSKYLKRSRNVIVLLPPGYENSGKRYPVLYAHDGQNLFNEKTSSAGEWRLDENISALQKKGLLQGIIVVGIYNTSARIDEYTPSRIKPGANKYLKNGGGGKLRAYARFIVEELKPMIDRKYRTLKGRKHTGVMGSSLGGLASFYILGWYPGVFSKAACISPSFWWDKQRVLRDIRNLRFPVDSRIYLDGGWKEGADESSMIKWMRLVKGGLLRKGLRDFRNIFYHEDPRGAHSEGDWARRGQWPLLFLFGKYRNTVLRTAIQLFPKRIGVGDSSNTLAQILLPGELPFTRTQGIRLAPTTRAVLRNGKLHALKPGVIVLYLRHTGRMYKKQISILPESRNAVTLRLIIHGRTGPFQLEYRKRHKWHSRPLQRTGKNSGILILKGKRGKQMRIRFRNSRGQYACKKTGQRLTPLLSFTSSQSIRLNFKYWSSR